jgi:hypothetical protein
MRTASFANLTACYFLSRSISELTTDDTVVTQPRNLPLHFRKKKILLTKRLSLKYNNFLAVLYLCETGRYITRSSTIIYLRLLLLQDDKQ